MLTPGGTLASQAGLMVYCNDVLLMLMLTYWLNGLLKGCTVNDKHTRCI